MTATPPDRPRTPAEPPIPDKSRDDSDAGWGDGPDTDDRDDDILRERPPHW